ncbi:MAG: radical SAM protein [Candidatus Omnitrophica bacterium]|nr:radical SAM protein [Candidatus Omnitrophota bacterium]
MHGLENNILNKVKFNNIWIFITEKCNLNCDYCFFTQRNQAHTLAFNQISSLIKRLPQNKRYDFVISGGEPLLCWRLTKRLLEHIKGINLDRSITLQTNMFFLSPDKIKFFKKKGLIIEPGIDGDFLSNFQHRKGFTKTNFYKCLRNLQLLVTDKLNMNPTMTVHPQETKFMFDNFKKLISLGLHSIDIHPAFLSDWNKEQNKEFIKQYKMIIRQEKALRRHLVCKNYSVLIKSSIDLVIQPDGFILPNWTFLAFPYNLRKKFFIFRLLNNDIIILKENLRSYLKELRKLFKYQKTYREFSNFNARLILKYIRNPRMKNKFLAYEELCKRIQKIDRLFLKKEDML